MSEQETIVVEERARNPVYIVLGVVVALFLLFLLWLFVVQPLLTDDDPDDADVVAVQDDDEDGTEQPELPDVTPSPDITEGEALPIETYEVFLSRDPFQPVRPAPVTAGEQAPTDGESPTDGQAPTDGQTPTDGRSPTDGRTPADGRTPTDGELPPTGENGDRTTVEGREIVLVDVFDDDGEPRAVIQVDGTAYDVGTGDRFADNFEVLALDPPCATLLFGDDSFTLCEGERVLK